MSGLSPLSPSKERLTGAVLCGGASTRMGRDKALIAIDGRPMARRVADTLAAAGCGRVVAIGGDRSALEAEGLEVVEDRWPGEGPLGGLATALSAGGQGLLLLAPCDWVEPSVEVCRRLTDAMEGQVLDGAGVEVEGRVQWLPSIWRVAAARPGVDGVFGRGERRLSAAATGLVTGTVALEAALVQDADVPSDLSSRVRRGRSH